MNDTSGSRRILFECVDVGHDIVSDPALLIGSHLEGPIADDEVCANGVEGLVGDLCNAEFLLGLGQPQPELTPGRDALPRGEDFPHLVTWERPVSDESGQA